MKNFKKYIASIIVFIFATLFLLNHAASSAQDSNELWKTYENPNFGISFEFPESWKLNVFEFEGSENAGEDFRMIFIEDEEEGEFHISLTPNQNKNTIEKYVESLGENYFGASVERIAEINLNGHEAIILGESSNGQIRPMLQAFILYDTGILQINFIGHDTETSPEPFNHILETLKFDAPAVNHAQNQPVFSFDFFTTVHFLTSIM